MPFWLVPRRATLLHDHVIKLHPQPITDYNGGRTCVDHTVIAVQSSLCFSDLAPSPRNSCRQAHLVYYIDRSTALTRPTSLQYIFFSCALLYTNVLVVASLLSKYKSPLHIFFRAQQLRMYTTPPWTLLTCLARLSAAPGY